jgi:hypothetical protein
MTAAAATSRSCGSQPSPFDQLEEPTLNAALAIIDSMQPQSELEALLAVQIIAAGFSGLRFLRQSQRHKLLRLQGEMIQAFDRHSRSFDPAAALPMAGTGGRCEAGAMRPGAQVGVIHLRSMAWFKSCGDDII